MKEESHPVRKQVILLGDYRIKGLEQSINAALAELTCPPDFIHIAYHVLHHEGSGVYFSAMIEYWQP